MELQSVRKTYKYRLYPTPEQERSLDTILSRCRALYNVALEERKTAWERCGVSLTYYHQANELPDLKAACPEYGEIHSQVLQDVLKRLERTYQTSFGAFAKAKSLGDRLQGSQPLPQLHLSPIRQRRGRGRRCAQPLQDRAYRYSPPSAHRRHTQDGHDQTRS